MATTINLSLSPGDLNLVLVALGQLPYVQVHELIGRIQTEAGPQLLAAAREDRGEPAAEAWQRR
jgi:hypothetical protein